MEITNVFKDEREGILKFITNLPKDNCIRNFKRYTNLCPEDDFEKKYVNKLNNNLHMLGKTLLKNKYSKLSKEELLKEVIECYIESPYSFEAYCENGELDDFIDYMTDSLEEAYNFIKSYMGECYNELIDEIDSSKKQNEIKSYKKMIKEEENRIERSQKEIKSYKEKLVQLEEE